MTSNVKTFQSESSSSEHENEWDTVTGWGRVANVDGGKTQKVEKIGADGDEFTDDDLNEFDQFDLDSSDLDEDSQDNVASDGDEPETAKDVELVPEERGTESMEMTEDDDVPLKEEEEEEVVVEEKEQTEENKPQESVVPKETPLVGNVILQNTWHKKNERTAIAQRKRQQLRTRTVKANAAVAPLGSIARIVHGITFNNKKGAALYRRAFTQLKAYAHKGFQETLKSKRNDGERIALLLRSAHELASGARNSVRVNNALFSYKPRSNKRKGKRLTEAVSLMGESFQHASFPFRGFSRDDDVEQMSTTSRRNTRIESDKREGFLEGDERTVDVDWEGDANRGTLDNDRGEVAVLFENHTKAMICWAVYYYRGMRSGQRKAGDQADASVDRFIDVMDRERFWASGSELKQGREILDEHDQLVLDEAKRILEGERVIIAPGIDTRLYARADGDLIEDAKVGSGNRKNNANIADRLNSKETIELLAKAFGSKEVAKKEWKVHTDLELKLWRLLARQGESRAFVSAMAEAIFASYQMGLLIDMRSRAWLERRVDTYDESLYVIYDDVICPKVCPDECEPEPEPVVCCPKVVHHHHYVYVQPPCCEPVEPNCCEASESSDECSVEEEKDDCCEVVVDECEPEPKPEPECEWEYHWVQDPPKCRPHCQKNSCAMAMNSLRMKLAGAEFADDEDKFEDIRNALGVFVNEQRKIGDREERVKKGTMMGQAVIQDLDKTKPDQLHMFSEMMSETLMALFDALSCSRSCQAHKLMEEIASFMHKLANRPFNAGTDAPASRRQHRIVTEFVNYIVSGPRVDDRADKFELIADDAPLFLKQEVRYPQALADTLMGTLNAVQDNLDNFDDSRIDKGGQGDGMEKNFIAGQWDTVYNHMLAKLGKDFKPSDRTTKRTKKDTKPAKAVKPVQSKQRTPTRVVNSVALDLIENNDSFTMRTDEESDEFDESSDEIVVAAPAVNKASVSVANNSSRQFVPKRKVATRLHVRESIEALLSRKPKAQSVYDNL